MSYQVLARKWRPKNFETVVGQEHVVRALTHALNTGRLHHAYLFTGTRGVGKTTLARILAKALNCEQGVSASPCGVCSACREIDEGRFIDLLEIDAATNTRVDEMRQLLENAAYAPTRGRYKVYVIDEVHMLSNSAFNAMLKTLEEPPEHIKFILATTDPQKIPVTVLSRCLQFNLKQMPLPAIVGHTTRLLEEEHIPFEPQALRHIAKAAAGSMRDALSLLDQAIAHGAGKLEDETVRAMLGTVGDDFLYAILDALAGRNVAALLAEAETMQARSLDFSAALQGLASLLQRLAIAQFSPESISDEFERNRLTPYTAIFSPEFVQLAYQIAIHGREDLALAPDEYAGFSMTLLRLAAFYPDSGRPSSPAPPPPPLATPKPLVTPTNSGESERPSTIEAKTPPPKRETPAPQALPSQMPQVAYPASAEAWQALVETLSLSPMAKEMAKRCEWQAGESPNGVKLCLDERHSHLANSAHQEKLKAALERTFGHPMILSFTTGATTHTPAQLEAHTKHAREAEAKEVIENDPFVQGLISHLGASIIPGSIQPR